MTDTASQADIGIVGVGVMGGNLALNMADHGFVVAVHDRDADRVDAYVADHAHDPFAERGGGLIGTHEAAAFVASLKRPRRIVLLVPAGAATDSAIESLAPLLDPDDVIIDCGNAHWEDTDRREAALRARGLSFVGSGTSGGAEGARFGPSLMVGCTPQAWSHIEPIWTAISAKVDQATGRPIETGEPGRPADAPGAEPCAARVGPGGSGHFVKMVHNGIEYADMQLICEAYQLLREGAGLAPSELSAVFAEWNAGDLDSYLIEITADILAQRDPITGQPFVDVVLDTAGQKGTGKWTSIVALDKGVAAPTIGEAVFARCTSALKEQRLQASEILSGPDSQFKGDPRAFIDGVRDALYCSKICAYAQGFAIMSEAAREFDWDLDFGRIAMIWRGGCIIRARFLQRIADAFDRNDGLPNLLLDEFFAAECARRQHGFRHVVSMAATLGLPAPAFASSLAYYDATRCARLPASLLQAQRDYFGGHTYERTDEPRGRFFHLDWSDPQRPQRQA